MKYQLQGFQDRNAEIGYDAERYTDTIKDARKQARYMLSDDYRNVCECSELLAKVQIWNGEELVDEIYGKEG